MKSLIARMGQGLLLVGTLSLGYAVLSWVYADAFQAYQQWVFDQSSNAALPSDDSVARLSPAPHSVIGRLEIPSLDLSVMVLEGADEQDLSLGVGRVPGTALPGENGNVVIAGHRDTFFRPLRKIQKNDTITLTTLQGTHRYQVESLWIAQPDDTEVLQSDSEAVLTLITCYPFSYVGPAPDRFIVRARKLSEFGS